MPPPTNMKIKPSANSIGVLNSIAPPHIVAIQLKTFTPVITPIKIVVVLKNAAASALSPTVNIW